MDITSVITIAAIVLANIGTMFGLFTWATNRADLASQNIRLEMRENGKETQRILESIQNEMKEFHLAMRDFHGRLVSIEERNSTRIVK
jgi:hypothetical protein